MADGGSSRVRSRSAWARPQRATAPGGFGFGAGCRRRRSDPAHRRGGHPCRAVIRGLISINAAAARPDLVRALVVAEASPAALDVSATDALAAEVEGELSSWPLPFRTRDDAIAYFGGPSISATAWTESLEERDDGLCPRFDIDVVVSMLREAVGHSQWSAWEQIECPVLVVRGETGSLAMSDAEEMVRRLASAQLVKVTKAGHDLHLQGPEEWRKALSSFLAALRG